MKKIKFNKKTLIWSTAIFAALAAIIIPVAVVFTSKDSNEEANPIEVVYGTELSNTIDSAPKIEGYKMPIIDAPTTTYNAITGVNKTDTKITFIYEPDGSNIDLKAKKIIYPIIVKKAEIQAVDVSSDFLTSQQVLEKGLAPDTVSKPMKLEKYTQWQNPIYKDKDGKSIGVDEIKNLNVADKFSISYTAIPDENHQTLNLTLQNITHTVSVVISLAALPIQDYEINSKNSMPKLDLQTILGYSQWSDPVYTIDSLKEVSDVTINFRPSNISYSSRFSFFSELYFYDNANNKIDYDVSEYTETVNGIVHGPTINHWTVPKEDLWIIKKFLTDGKAGPDDTKKELIDSRAISSDRLLFEGNSSGINLLLKRDDYALSGNSNRILILDSYQTSINTQRLKLKFKNPAKLQELTYYFASIINSDLEFSFTTVDGTVFKPHHSSLITVDGRDITQFKNKIRDGFANVEKTERVTLDGGVINDNYWKIVWPINVATLNYKIGKLTLESVDDLNNLGVNTSFTATYRATKLPDALPGPDLTYQVQYKTLQGKAANSPGNTTPVQSGFLLNSTSLPADKTGSSAIGYLPWSMPEFSLNTDPTVKFTKLIELRNLSIGTKFFAVYKAEKNPKYNATADAIYTVEYTVMGVANSGQVL